MEPLTSATFGLKQGSVAVPGVVSYLDRQAVFTPTNSLLVSTSYTATVTADAEDLAGNTLSAAHTWSFETDATTALGPAPVLLGASGNYAILAKSAISNVPTSAVTGDLGLSPAAASYVTGFALTRSGVSWTSPQVVGNVFAADNDPPTPSELTTAVDNMQAAYTDAAGRPTPDFLNLGAGAIGGLTLTPGLYQWTSSVTIPTDVTISGAANDVWIFQITDDLVMSAAKNMILIGGARAKNIFWQVAGSVDLGTTAHFEGIILSKTAITLGTGASINGRLLAQTAVNIAGTTVVEPAP
jgi:Ice-binding-like/Bacterial Ig-like domain